MLHRRFRLCTGLASKFISRRRRGVHVDAGKGKVSGASSSLPVHDGIALIRNIGIIAHIDAGKTTTSEQMLFLCGETKSVGRVDTGDTVMDFLPQERERGITIQAAAITMAWKGHRINLIDTPGHVDFTIEVERSVRVIDGAVVIVDAVSGVQAQTKTVWRQACKQGLPAVAFVNKMDRDGASFERALVSVKTKLGANVVPLQLPILDLRDGSFLGVVDLLSMNKTLWEQQQQPSSTTTNSRVPPRATVAPLDAAHDAGLYQRAREARRVMVESIVETNEELMDVYLEQGEGAIDLAGLLAALRAACLQGAIVPAMCGASLRCRGVEPLLDAVLAFLPSPLDKPKPTWAVSSIEGKPRKDINPASTQDLCALAFKIVHDASRGPLVFVRTFSGSLSPKQVLRNSSSGHKERLNQLLSVTADDLAPLAELGPGNVGCIVGLKHTVTGDTLVLDRGPLHDYALAGLSVPRPVFSMSVEPEQSSQQTDLEAALAIMCVEDPSLKVEVDKESGQTLLRGIGELHLEIVRDKLLRQFGIAVATGRAYVAYRESLALTEPVESVAASLQAGRYTRTLAYDKTIGTKRLYALLTMTVVPLDNADDAVINLDKARLTNLSAEERLSLLEGIQGALSRGPKGFPVVGIKVSVDAVERDGDTTPGAIRACAALLLDAVLRSPEHALLEPLMDLEITLPVDHVGNVLSDLTVKRRALVKEVVTGDEDQRSAVVLARVPLATMLGYATSIRSMTQGEGAFSMEFAAYSAPVDPSLLLL